MNITNETEARIKEIAAQEFRRWTLRTVAAIAAGCVVATVIIAFG
jgi:hypothetical protein